MQHVAGQMKCKILLELVDRAEIFFLARCLQFSEDGVGSLHIGSVMLAVMQLELPRGVVGFQRGVIVGELR